MSTEEQKRKHREYMREYSKNNRENIREINRKSSKKWREAHPDKVAENKKIFKDRSNIYILNFDAKHPGRRKNIHKKWEIANKTKEVERARKYRKENPEKVKETVRKYHKANPEVSRISQYRRRTKLKGAASFSKEEWRKLCAFYEHRCLCCGEVVEDLTVDHVIPLSKGGVNTIDNIQPLCDSCNKKKHIKEIDYRKVVNFTNKNN